MRCGLSIDDGYDSVGIFGNENGEFCGLFSLSVTAACSFRLLRIDFATGRNDGKNVSARLADTARNIDDCVQCLILRLSFFPAHHIVPFPSEPVP